MLELLEGLSMTERVLHAIGGDRKTMKKDRLDVVVLSLISSLVLSSCHATSGGSEQVKVNKPLVTNVETVKENDMTKEKVKKFVKDHKDEYGDIIYDLKSNEIHIEEKTFKNQTLYFFLYTPNDYWETTLYQIRETDGVIQALDYISSGATDYFNFDIISISEGDFVTVYSASHMGNGSLELMELESIPERKVGEAPDYELYAIDNHFEGVEGKTGKPTSKVFHNGMLTPEYKDVNNDGNTDVVLNGVVEEYEYNKETSKEELQKSEKVCEVYLFNPKDKTFTLQSDNDLREKKPLSIGDTVVNNHELLNDSPCTEYKVQDIYQYQGEPEKIVEYEDEYGAFRHYLVYEGIIYVVLNDKPELGKEEVDNAEYIDYVILTNDIYSLSIGIQVGMSEKELTETGIDFSVIKNGDDLDSEFLSGKTGYLRKMKIAYDTIYYGESSYDENIAIAVIVKNGKVVRIATDKLY